MTKVWTLADQAQALRNALSAANAPVTPADLAKAFKGAKKARVSELLETLAALGQCREVDDDRFVA